MQSPHVQRTQVTEIERPACLDHAAAQVADADLVTLLHKKAGETSDCLGAKP